MEQSDQVVQSINGQRRSILKTKLFVPSIRSNHISRPHLIERLNEGISSGCKLTLVSAPAGFGKTTLVCEWITSCGMPVAWISLDEGDNDPARFTSYLVKALQMIQVGIGEGLLAALQSPQPLQIETILIALLNEISTIPDDFLFVLDDFHMIDSKPVDQFLAFLVDHQPLQMHLVIATREDPALPLARLRGRGQCTELRAADLRFTPAEATDFLNRVMGLDLSEADVVALEARTEGWIAGLQLAALSMQGQTDVAGFIQSFTGSHHFVMDYLIEEVLEQQPESIQAFLLRTSVLDRICGPLCDAVLHDPSVSGQATLEYLERANLFIIPLDNERRWYRYHQLFGDLLRKRLGLNLTPEGLAELHIHASEWYENNSLMLEAFSHAAAANDIERAVRLMESKNMPIHLRGTATTILDWLVELPDTMRNTRPVLWWKQAALMLIIGQTKGVEEILQAAEAALEAVAAPSAEYDETTRDLIGKIAAVRANLAQTQAEIEVVFVQARRALEYLHPNNLSYRSLAERMLGFAYYWQGDWTEANRAYIEALSLAHAAGDIPNYILASIRLGQLQEDKGQLYLAAEAYQHALKLIVDYLNSEAVVAYLGLAQIFYQWNNLDTAEQYAEQGLKLAQQYDQIIDRIIMSELHLAIIKLARRDIIGATQMVSQAEQTAHQRNFTTRLPNLAFFQTLIYLDQGNLDAAAQLTSQYDLPLMRARVLIKQNDASAALAVLEPLRQDAEEKGLARRLLDVMTVQSVALQAHGEKQKAVELLGEVLAQAEPNGFIRLYLDEGALMAQLLSEVTSLGVMPNYVGKLLAAFEAEKRKAEDKPDLSPALTGRHRDGDILVESFSQRELTILQLIAQGLSNREIGLRLYLALDTVKGYNRRIFNKLQAQNRTEAVARARALGLL